MTAPLTRRSVLLGTAVSVVGGVVGFLTARNTDAAKAAPTGTRANGYGPAPASSTPAGSSAATGVLLTSASAVPQGGGVVLSSKKVVVTKDGSGSIHAFSAVCTHQGCLVSSVSGGTINCPCHGSRFNADTGAVVQGPATVALPVVAVTTTAGNVYTVPSG